ncbi:MAG TPA: NAD(P)H-hydrate dehydratase [Gemmatimonadaceae bacterium]|nr:NAD(P)H-hydrate dehydratase [Gemmatimonadaceae bacterium]
MRQLVGVVDSQESVARDASAIGRGAPSRALMQRAGAAAATEIALRCRDRLDAGVLVLAGPGNNGGDAWVVAGALAAAGVRIRVVEPVAAKTDDARAERESAMQRLDPSSVESRATALSDHGERLVVDGLLGTGASGSPREPIASAIAVANEMRARGAIVVSIDVPSGLDATTGFIGDPAISADVTLTFGAIKRGLLINREHAGGIVALDIGLPPIADDGSPIPLLVDEWWVASRVPPIGADAHKGVRKKLAIVGGAPGMAGASVLAARSAMRSGVGMVKLVVDARSLAAVQETEPNALAATWPADDGAMRAIAEWADAVVIGPGLGRSEESRALLDRVLRVWRGPTLLDADALTLWAGHAADLGAALGARPALITPHVAEFARLAGTDAGTVLNERFHIGAELARILGAAVLLKGVPTVVTASDGTRRLVSATGTPALATGGSGDLLSGIAGTMLAQIGDPFVAGAVAAWVHGRAAERVPATRGVRGIVLDDVVSELRESWTFDARPTRYPVLAELPSLGPSRRPAV